MIFKNVPQIAEHFYILHKFYLITIFFYTFPLIICSNIANFSFSPFPVCAFAYIIVKYHKT